MLKKRRLKYIRCISLLFHLFCLYFGVSHIVSLLIMNHNKNCCEEIFLCTKRLQASEYVSLFVGADLI